MMGMGKYSEADVAAMNYYRNREHAEVRGSTDEQVVDAAESFAAAYVENRDAGPNDWVPARVNLDMALCRLLEVTGHGSPE